MEFYQDTEQCNNEFHRGKMFIVNQIGNYKKKDNGSKVVRYELRSRFYIATCTFDYSDNTLNIDIHGNPNAPHGLSSDYSYPSSGYYGAILDFFDIDDMLIRINRQDVSSKLINIDIQAMKMLEYTIEQVQSFVEDYSQLWKW